MQPELYKLYHRREFINGKSLNSHLVKCIAVGDEVSRFQIGTETSNVFIAVLNDTFPVSNGNITEHKYPVKIEFVHI